MHLEARSYQTWGVNVLGNFLETKPGHPLYLAPTATGKTICIALFLIRYFEQHPTHKALVLTHDIQIIGQNVDKLKKWWPEAPVSIYSAGLKIKDHSAQIVNAGIASIIKIDPVGVDLVIVDECHLVSDKDTTMYHKFFKKTLHHNPNCRWIGFSATGWRQKLGCLTNGGVFTDIAVDMTKMDLFNWFFENGYLSYLRPQPTDITLSVHGLRTTAGDYNLKDQQAKYNVDPITIKVCEEIIAKGQNRKHWLIFASGLEHAQSICRVLQYNFVRARSLSAESEDRHEVIADFESGKIRALVVFGLLTTGYDFDALDLIAVVRATKSAGLWVQMLGRGDRPLYAPGYDLLTKEGRLAAIAASGKPDCLVLDFAGNTKRLGPINDPVIPTGKKGVGEAIAPVRLCDKCNTYVHASLKVCPHCGNIFPISQKIKATSGTDVLVKTNNESELKEYIVDRVIYSLHMKEKKSMLVTYHCNLKAFREWVCFEHNGYPRHTAEKWWAKRSLTPVPKTVEEALSRLGELKTCSSIRVKYGEKYSKIDQYCLHEAA